VQDPQAGGWLSEKEWEALVAIVGKRRGRVVGPGFFVADEDAPAYPDALLQERRVRRGDTMPWWSWRCKPPAGSCRASGRAAHQDPGVHDLQGKLDSPPGLSEVERAVRSSSQFHVQPAAEQHARSLPDHQEPNASSRVSSSEPSSCSGM